MFTVDPRIVSINNATERKLTATHLKSSGALEEFSCHPFSSSGSSESSLPFDLSSLRITSADGQIIDVAQFLPSDWPPGDLQLIVLGADPQNLVFSLTEAYSTSLYGFMNSSTMDVSIGGVSAQPGQFIRLAMGVPQWSTATSSNKQGIQIVAGSISTRVWDDQGAYVLESEPSKSFKLDSKSGCFIQLYGGTVNGVSVPFDSTSKYAHLHFTDRIDGLLNI